MQRRWVGRVAALVAGLDLVVLGVRAGGGALPLGLEPAAEAAEPAPTLPFIPLATTRRTPPPPPARRPPPPVPLEAYRGLGTWVDVYDWSRAYGRGGPLVGPADIDRMAQLGVQTLFIQAAKREAPTDLVDADLLGPIVRRAHLRGLRVVGWYLPTLEDPSTDLRRLVAIARLGVDGVAVDIESRKVVDPAERTRRLVGLSAALRRALPRQSLGAIVLPPVFLDVVNPRYWPGFPWRQLASSYDVWLPMGYWTQRRSASGWRSGYRFTIENVARLRRHLGVAGAPVHFIGGIGTHTIPADIGGMNRGAAENGVLGASLYDWRTTRAELWHYLQPLHWNRR